MKLRIPQVVYIVLIVLLVAVVFYYSGMSTLLTQNMNTFVSFFASSPTPTHVPPPLADTPLHIKKSRTDAIAHYQRAKSIGEKGNTEEVKMHLHNAMKSDPTYSPPYELYGVLMALEGNYVESIHYLETAIDLNPDSAQAAIGLGIAYAATGDTSLANEWLSYASARTSDVSIKKQIDTLSQEINAQ